jgi:hypothetical protein
MIAAGCRVYKLLSIVYPSRPTSVPYHRRRSRINSMPRRKGETRIDQEQGRQSWTIRPFSREPRTCSLVSQVRQSLPSINDAIDIHRVLTKSVAPLHTSSLGHRFSECLSSTPPVLATSLCADSSPCEPRFKDGSSPILYASCRSPLFVLVRVRWTAMARAPDVAQAR